MKRLLFLSNSKKTQLFIGVSAIIAILFLSVIGKVIAQSDTTPPEIKDFSFTPSSINTANGSQSITVTVRATDDLSGVSSVRVIFTSPSGSFGRDISMDNGSRISGDNKDGIYRNVITFSQNDEIGIWRAELHTHDVAGNSKNFSTSELVSRGFPTKLLNGTSLTPLITSIDPSSFGYGASPIELTVTGENFTPDSVVRWNGQNKTTTFLSSTQLRTLLLAPDLSAVGQYQVTVFNPGGGISNAVIFTVTACYYSLDPTYQYFTPTGGNGTIEVVTSIVPGCTWTAQNNASWITISSGSSGSGFGTVQFNVPPNVGPSRTGTIIIAGQTVTIAQGFFCKYSAVSPSTINVPVAGGAFSISISRTIGCPPLNISILNSPFITAETSTITTTETITDTYTYSVSPNNGGSARTGFIQAFGLATQDPPLTTRIEFTINQAAGTSVLSDFDGDGRADISVFRPDDGIWYLLNSTSGFAGIRFGLGTDKIIPADFDGDRKADIAVWRENPDNPGRANFYILRSPDNLFQAVQFGATGDIPLSGDFDGDGKADLAVYRKGANNSQSYFYYRPTTQPGVNFIAIQWGLGDDKPAVADYDGDGKTDIAVYRPSNGVWYIQRSRDGFYAIQFGIATDKPVPADYDGDGKADVAVFRVENGVWYLQRSRDGFAGFAFGYGTDKPVPADYDGDGKTDIAVFRDGTWYLQRSTAGFSGVHFGIRTDKPIPNAFVQ